MNSHWFATGSWHLVSQSQFWRQLEEVTTGDTASRALLGDPLGLEIEAAGASCRRSPSQASTLPSLELSDSKGLGLLPTDNHPHYSRVLRLGGLFPNSWDCLDSEHWATGVEEGEPYLWLRPLYDLSRPCSQEVLLGPSLLQSELFLTAPQGPWAHTS